MIQHIFIIGELLDALTTMHALRNGGREGNPLMKLVFDRVGVGPGIMGSVIAHHFLSSRATPFTTSIKWMPVINNFLVLYEKSLRD